MEMDGRQQRGLEIAATKQITKKGAMWVVPSQSDKGRYGVTIDGDTKHCTCPDFEERQQPCKHVFAVEFVMRRETVTDGDTTVITETAAVRVTYAQNWPAYNAAQVSEKATFVKLLRDLCAGIPEPPQSMGRPRLPLADMIFSAGFKVYSTVSARRFMTDLREAHADGLISQLPCYNSIFNYLESEELTPIIRDMVTRSALPLRAVETDFAIDSTGFTSTQLMGVWRAEKYGAKATRREHDWLKLHAVCGVNTNVIAAVEVTPRNSQDSPQFAPLIEATAQHFNVQRVLGDKAYSSRANLELTESKGAVPFIPFKSYAVGTTKNETWNRLYHYYALNRDEFLKAYHKRSNVESTFSAMKRKFGDFVRSRTPIAQVNELLLKVLAYNIVCVVHSMHEFGVNPSFPA
ncbi:MAG: transposase [Deltaproteobacteria bacterium]|nr:transposase [Deltaproteobacteria bacterium]MBI3390292.1 transposase [Deltaproteobacteria bacterium]